MAIKIATVNSRGGDTKTPHIIRMCNLNKLDICFLQETHSMKIENVRKIEKETKTKIFQCPGGHNSRGVMTIIKESPIMKNAVTKKMDNDGNFLIVQVSIENITYELINIYAPITPANRVKLFEKINREIQGNEYCIIAGDFNNYEDFQLDCTGGSRKNFELRKSDRRKLEELKSTNGYLDSLRVLHPTKRMFTFTGISNYRSRLDRIYVHNMLTRRLTEADVVPVHFSDHDLYYVKLKTDTETDRIIWGKGLWKFNKKTLEENENMKELKKMWEDHQHLKPRYENLCTWWEHGKRKLKHKCIEIGKTDKRKINDQRQALESELQQLNRNCQAGSSKRILEVKRLLNKMDEEDMKGAQIRSRAQWQKQGEKCTRYFFSLERRNGNDKQLRELIDENGNMYTEKIEVLNYMKKFYENRYRETNLNDDSCKVLLDSVTNRLTDDQRAAQAGDFNMHELEKVMQNMKTGKSPGGDGLTTEFYLEFWPTIKYDLLEVLNEIRSTLNLPLSMTQAMITIIYKNKGDRRDLNNWRAISLCNLDFKLLTGIIASRLDEHLPELIHEDQCCGVKNRWMQDSLIYLHDMMEYIKQFGGKSCIYGLDLQAAFDNVHHVYLERLLERLNISFKLRDLLKIIHNNMYSSIAINGTKTPFFKLNKSIRTGDKASMSCFILAVEPLANIIRRDNQIQRLRLPNTRPKSIVQYCDDMSLILSDVKDIARINRHTKIYEKGSGAKFNASKSEIMMIGRWSNQERAMVPAENRKDNLKLLGVWMGPDSKILNREQITRKIDETLEFWRNVPMSFDGKRLIIQTKVLPQLYHIVRIVGMDNQLKREVQKRITDFVWYPKKMKLLRYDTLKNPIKDGGLDMPDLEVLNQAILTERIPRILTGNRIWSGTFIFRLGLQLKYLRAEFASNQYEHTRVTTPVTATIATTYRKIDSKVPQWEMENFKTLKQKLTNITEYKKRDPTRDYSQTWTEIRTCTDNRKSRDLSYMIAHGAAPVAATLKRRNVTNDDSCRLCRNMIETREHLFIRCRLIQDVMKILVKLVGRTPTEEEMIYYESLRGKMKKKEKTAIASLKKTIWEVRAKIYYGDITGEQSIKENLERIYCMKMEL